MSGIRYPFGAATVLALTATGAQALTIDNALTIIDGVTVQGTADRTLNLTVDDELEVGATIILKTKTDGTENTVFGTGFLAPTYAGVAAKTIAQTFRYDGTQFIATGAKIQLN